MRELIELEKGVKGSEELKIIAMDIAQFIFTKSQENLVEPMPWGDKDFPSDRKPSRISDTSLLLLSGVPPYWEDSTKIVFRYDAPHAPFIEYGTPPHPVGASRLVGWVNRKLKKKGKKGLSIAYAIATKIKKEGMDPHPYVRPAIDAATRKYKLITVRVET